MKPNSTGRTLELDEATCIYGAGILKKHLQAFAQEVESVRDARPDIEHVHRARVASRRLRAALPLFASCLPAKKTREWMKQIRAVTRSLGEARDADVQLQRVLAFSAKAEEKAWKPGLARLALRLQQKRAGIQPAVADAMRRVIAGGLIDELGARLDALIQRGQSVYIYTPTLYQHSFRAIHSRLEAFLAYEEIVHQPEKVAELHEMRIEAKRLRYTIETFASLYANQLKPYLQAVRKAQDLLGDIHDCDVWQVFLPQFLAEERARIAEYFGHERPLKRLVPGILALQEDRKAKRAALYEEFVGAWQQWQADGIWEALRSTIQAHSLQPGALYPPAAGPRDHDSTQPETGSQEL